MKIRVLILLAIALLLSACDKEEERIEDTVLGAWDMIEFSQSQCIATSSDFSFEVTDSACVVMAAGTGGAFEDCLEGTITFTDDKYLLFVELSLDDNKLQEIAIQQTYTIDGNILSLCENGNSGCANNKLEINDDILTITGLEDSNGCILMMKARKN